MRSIRVVVVVVVLAALAAALAAPPLAAAPLSAPKEKEPQIRTLQGFVYGQGDTPLPGAVVYLKNTRNLAVKSLYAGDDGSYRFNALSPNTDYEVFAEYKGKKSDTKTLSSFDSRLSPRINLHIDIAK